MIHHAETSRADRALPAQRCNGIHRRAAERTDTRWKVPGMFEIHKRWGSCLTTSLRGCNM